MTTGQRLKEFRKMKDISQQKLACELGIDSSRLSHIENGNKQMSLEILRKVVKILGCSYKELLDGDV